jgi:hypothetical protein
MLIINQTLKFLEIVLFLEIKPENTGLLEREKKRVT